jgi:hypothetical protein
VLLAFTMQRVSEYPVVGPRPKNGEELDDTFSVGIVTAFAGGYRRTFIAAKAIECAAHSAGQLAAKGHFWASGPGSASPVAVSLMDVVSLEVSRLAASVVCGIFGMWAAEFCFFGADWNCCICRCPSRSTK